MSMADETKKLNDLNQWGMFIHLSQFCLGTIFAILCFLLIGIPLLLVLAVVGVVFPIIGAVKANNGEVWSYPCSIKFFK